MYYRLLPLLIVSELHLLIFVWKPNDSDTMKAIAPTYNTLVINDESELHFVTPISYNTDTFRVTIQIFAPI